MAHCKALWYITAQLKESRDAALQIQWKVLQFVLGFCQFLQKHSLLVWWTSRVIHDTVQWHKHKTFQKVHMKPKESTNRTGLTQVALVLRFFVSYLIIWISMKIGQSATGTPPPGHHLAIPNRLYIASAPVKRDISLLVCHMFSPQCYLTSGTHCQFVLHTGLERFQFGILVLSHTHKKKTNTHVFQIF